MLKVIRFSQTVILVGFGLSFLSLAIVERLGPSQFFRVLAGSLFCATMFVALYVAITERELPYWRTWLFRSVVVLACLNIFMLPLVGWDWRVELMLAVAAAVSGAYDLMLQFLPEKRD
jgi:hypothetical protein